ncbi:MAG: two-component regulator propeller domain-containing protein, partial [bacterium]
MYFERSTSGAVAAMCKRVRCIALLPAILSLPVVVHAQTALTFDHITVDDGLSQNEVRCIIQDKFGFLWFGTSDGLNLYDGYQIRTYNHDPSDSTSLLENFIGVMLTDSSGTLWIGTRRGLCLLTVENRETGKFERFEMAEVSALMEARDGAVWVVTNRAILKYSKKGEVLSEFEYSLPVHEYGILRAAYQDRGGIIWFADGLTLCRFNAESIGANHQPHFEYYPFPVVLRKNREFISHIFQPESVPDDVLWISTTRGLLQFDANEEKFTPISTPASFAREMASRNIERIFEDSDKKIWVSSINFGLYKFAADLNSFEFFWHNPAKLPSPIEWVNKRKLRAKDSVNTIWWLSKTKDPKANVNNVRV